MGMTLNGFDSSKESFICVLGCKQVHLLLHHCAVLRLKTFHLPLEVAYKLWLVVEEEAGILCPAAALDPDLDLLSE